jgi:hypothetical protein
LCKCLHSVCVMPRPIPQIWKTRSCAGISGKAQILFLVVFVTRYLDLVTNFISVYNTTMKVFFVGSSAATVYLMYVKFKATYDGNHDTFRCVVSCSVADPGCKNIKIKMFFPDPSFFTFFHPGFRICFKEFKYFNPRKWFLSSRKYDPGCSSRIRDPEILPTPDPNPGVNRHRIPDTGSATLLLVYPCPASPEKEDPSTRELLRRADSTGPVSPICT